MHPLRSTPDRRTRCRCRPCFDHLEERALLSTVTVSDPQTETFGVVQMDPAAASVLTQTPSTVTVTFNLPVDPFSLGVADFGLDQVSAGGGLTPLDPTGALGLVTEVGVSDTSPNSVVLDINQALPTGQYEVMLLGSTMIAGLDASYNDVFWSPPNGFGTDTPIGGFTIATPGVTVAQATNLGVVGSSTVVTLGALDLGANPSAVSLYQFTLAPGNTWLFGAEIFANQIHSPLRTTLALFSDVNGQGELVKTATVGGPAWPNDPYLFAGLRPGTYYIGVSGAGNVPGMANGYDPFAGTAGVSSSSVGGTFQLDLAAVPQTGPTEVQNFTLNYADPLSTTPTGFTLQFSGPIDTAGLEVNPFTALDIVDQSGKRWGITPIAYSAAMHEFTFIFESALPAGEYTLEVPSQGGMTDLAGLSPEAPGQPAGELAHWTVESNVAAPGPYDLGVVYPDATANISFSAVLSPGASVTYKFTLLATEQVPLTAFSAGGPVSIQLTGPNTRLGSDGAGTLAVTAASGNFAILGAGVYHLTLTASGSGSSTVAANLQALYLKSDFLVANAVGQGPALNLLFASSPSTSSTGQSQAPAPTGIPSAPAVVVSATSGNTPGAALSATPTVPSAPAGLVVTIGGSLAGTLGPLAVPTTVSLPTSASTGEGPAFVTASPNQPIPLRAGNPASPSASEAVAAEVDDEVSVAGADGTLMPEVAPVVPSRDVQVLADGVWIMRLAARFREWVSFVRPPVAEQVAPAVPPAREIAVSPARMALQRDDLPPSETERLDRAEIGLPIGIGVVSLAVLRLRHPIRRWCRARRAAQTAAAPRRGPHRSF